MATLNSTSSTSGHSGGDIDIPLVAVTLTGSLLSVLGTTFILICYMILPQKRHIRHALIINLTIADFINAANNSASGLWVLVKREKLRASTGCTLNGFVGQLSVQGVDFSILMITMVTTWIVTSSHMNRDLSVGYILAFCLTPWAIPLITSGVALIIGKYGPASSNWCWIVEKPHYLRYVLTHGWRFVIIAAVIVMCLYIQYHLRRHEKMMSEVVRSEEVQGWREATMANVNEKLGYSVEMTDTSSRRGILEDDRIEVASPDPIYKSSTFEGLPDAFHSESVDPQNELMLRPQTKKDHQISIQRAMLLHAYPVFYIILWIPGIAMRISQATGGHSRVLEVLQSSTQFIGFANALTFGWNEKIWEQLKAKVRRNFRT